jgi:hypothetical protein
MGIKVLIFVLVVVLQLIALCRIMSSAEGTDNFGAGAAFFLLLAVFAVLDTAAVVWFLIAVWR